jgi:uncharacterized membrane protein YphA (DoxX/SURF4 family)
MKSSSENPATKEGIIVLVRRIARPLLSSSFVGDGVSSVLETQTRAENAAPLLRFAEARLPRAISVNLPADPATLVRVNAALQIAAGVSLAFGKAPRLSALTLAGTVIPASVSDNAFWIETDPRVRSAKRAAFLRSLSQLGGLIIAAVDTEGKPSVAWRGRRAARRLAASVTPDRSAGPAAIGEQVAETAQRAFDAARDRAPQVAQEVRENASALAEGARTAASELIDSASAAARRVSAT